MPEPLHTPKTVEKPWGREIWFADQAAYAGKILEVKTDSHRVLIEGVNMIKRHVRPTQDNPKGGVIEREGTIHVSNVRLLNRPAAGKRDEKKAKDKPAKGKK